MLRLRSLAWAVATAAESARVWACDLTRACVSTARHNVEPLDLADRVEVRRGDLFAPLPIETFGRTIDLVIRNPPCIPVFRLEGDKAHLLRSQPRAAFDCGLYGFPIHQRRIGAALHDLRPGGWIALEFGERQEVALFRRAGGHHGLHDACDAQDAPRVAVAQRSA